MSDSSTHYDHSYLDNHVHVHRNGDIFNIHIIVILMYERHTALNMYKLLSIVLDVLCPRWRSKLIGLGSDDASNMTGKDNGIVTLFEQEAEYQIYRV